MKPSEDLLIRNNGAGLSICRYLSPAPQPVNFVRQSDRRHACSATRPGRPGVCPTLTVLLRQTIHDHLSRSRPEIVLNVFQRIRVRFFRACGLARIIHECRCEAFETDARRGFSQVRPMQAYVQSVEEAEREQPRRARGSDDGAGIHE